MGLLVAASTLIAVYVNVFLGIDTVYTHFFYVPIVLTAVWYYWKAAYLALFLGVLHISMGWFQTGTLVSGTLIRAVSLLAVALIVAYLSAASGRLYDRLRQSSEEELRGIFNGVTEAMFIYDLGGKVLETNDRAAQVCGVSREQAARLSFRDCCSGVAGDNALFVWERARSGEDQVFECTFRRPADGSAFPAEVCLRKVQLRGSLVILASVRDITRRKKTETELSEARRQAELYVDLMGHDINNLNQVGIGYLEIALDTLDCDADGKYLLQRPLESMKCSSRLIDNVRLIQRLQTEPRKPELIDLGFLLSEVVEEYAHVPGRDINIDYAPVSGCCVLAGAQLREAFRNLVSNSIDHSAGPLSIHIALEKRAENSKPYYQIRIEDDGPGIPDLLKSKLFNRTARGRPRTSGSGLGLFIVRSLIEDADGSVTVEDRVPGDHTKGCRFVVILPAAGKRV